MPAHLQLLALDTSTDTMSIAVAGMRDGAPHVWAHTGAGGAQASATLIPAIMELMGRAGLDFGDLDVIAFGCGPGAFTGLRTACSVAQGLAFGARVPPGRPALQVLPVDTLLALAEQARSAHVADGQPLRVLAMLDARMDELYAAAYAFDGQRWTQHQDCQLVRPENLAVPAGWLAQGFLLAGNVFAAYGARLPVPDDVARLSVLPSAAAMLRLAGDLLARGAGVEPEHALPTYVRDKVAQTTTERAASKAASNASIA
jgi:tRNA threonylcarbamoyladenosine biosynthesis protein TsaB